MRPRAAHLPVVEHGQAEGLALRVVAQVGLEAKGLDDRQEGLHNEDGRARLGHVCGDVPSPLGQHRIDGGDAVCARTGKRRMSQACLTEVKDPDQAAECTCRPTRPVLEIAHCCICSADKLKRHS